MILFFGNLPIDSSHVKDIGNLSEINNYTFVPFTGSIVHTVHNVNTNFILDLCSWTLFLDRYKSKGGGGASCVLIDQNGTKIMISCKLQFECTKNIVEYEAFVHGIKKAIDLGAQVIE